jgi:hypothetical protein
MPSTSSRPNPRTIGTGESSSTRNPVAVATPAVKIVGPPATTAATAGSGSPRASASSKRAWNWIA